MPDRVVIIGAGLAGLSAACMLKEAGVPFTVLEARSSAGGRVRTLHGYFDDDLFVELGGEHVPNIHYRVLSYLRRFRVGTTAGSDPSLQDMLWFRGKRVFLKAGSPVHWPRGIKGVVDGKNQGDIEGEFVGPVLPEIGDPADPGWPHPEGLKFDARTTAGLLRSQGATSDQIQLFKLGLNSLDGDGLEVNSALFQLSSANAFRGFVSSVHIAGGSQTLPEAMARHLRPHVRFTQPVKEIRTNGTRFEILYGAGSGQLSCQHLIVAIPYAVLRRIPITPRLPALKRQVIRDLPNTSVTRTFLQFRERVWEQVGLSGAVDTDQIVMSIFPGPPSQAKRGILESYTAGPTARKLGKISEKRRVEIVLEQLNRLFPGVSKCYEKSFSIIWDADPWARGAYAYYAAGQVKALYGQAAVPSGRMAFAGDHTTSAPGWMESAILSGERAARETIAML